MVVESPRFLSDLLSDSEVSPVADFRNGFFLHEHKRPTVSVVIPALNEADNLPYVLPHIPQWVDEVILVDGDSTDETVALAQSVYPTIKVIRQEAKGKGAALRSGFARATGDIVVMLDGDGSTDPSEIPAFVGALLAGSDFAKGSRTLQGGGTLDMPFYRRIGNRMLTTLTNLLFGTRYTDITYGYNATWRRCAYALALEIDGWACEIVTNIRVARYGLRITEVSSFEYNRIAGQAKLEPFTAGWTILKAILRERFRPYNSTAVTTHAWWSTEDLFVAAMQLLFREALCLSRHRKHLSIEAYEFAKDAVFATCSTLQSLDSNSSYRKCIQRECHGRCTECKIWAFLDSRQSQMLREAL
jgi:glycosyltransferase involved in cell wall biosynthesis